MLGTILESKWIKFSVQGICLLLGLYMLYYQFKYAFFDMGINPWNARLYALLAFGIIAFGVAIASYPQAVKMLVKFAIMFIALTVVFLFVGGFFVAGDMASGTNYSGGNIWVAYDALGTIADVGKAAIMISQAAIYLIPLTILASTVCMVFYSDTTDDLQSAVIEGAISFGFMAVYGFLGAYFGWIP